MKLYFNLVLAPSWFLFSLFSCLILRRKGQICLIWSKFYSYSGDSHFQEFLSGNRENPLTLVERRVKMTSCKSGKGLTRPGDLAEGPHANCHDRAMPKNTNHRATGWHDYATPTRAARSPSCPRVRPCRRDLNASRCIFWGLSLSFLFRSLLRGDF